MPGGGYGGGERGGGTGGDMASFSKTSAGEGSVSATKPSPRLSFADAVRRSSRSRNNATATMRLSLSDIVNTHGKDHHEEVKNRQENAELARSQRRRSSLLQMGVANSGIMEAASSVLKQVAEDSADTESDASPVEKLQTLLTKAKERGMSAEKLFEHFAPNGEESVTPAMFEAALRKLGKRMFDLDEMELEHLVQAFDTDGNGSIELNEFMTFCLSIPSLPWRAEKARRLNNAESKDELNVAARKVARRRSSLTAVSIGNLIHQGSLFFWRSKENLDVAFHYNSDEGLVTISTRCLERGYNYPAIIVDASKIPVSKAMAVEKASPSGQFDGLTPEGRQEAIDKAMDALRVEYLEQRLKVPDDVNAIEQEVRTEESGSDSSDTSSSGEDDEEEEDEEGKSGGTTTAVETAAGGAAAAAASGAGGVPAAGGGTRWMLKPGGMTPKERAADKMNHRPFLAKLSTDSWDTLLCVRNIVLQTPHRFETAAPRASMDDFRRASIEFGKLAKETEKLASVAESKTQAVGDSIESIAATDEAAR
eukprot:jgi/Undpi1/12250/HiC_scaffold_5.g01926.m1